MTDGEGRRTGVVAADPAIGFTVIGGGEEVVFTDNTLKRRVGRVKAGTEGGWTIIHQGPRLVGSAGNGDGAEELGKEQDLGRAVRALLAVYDRRSKAAARLALEVREWAGQQYDGADALAERAGALPAAGS